MNLLDAFYLPLAAITAPWWARKTRSGWGERFGYLAPVGERGDGERVPRVLLHAVSVGEVNTLRGLAPMLVERGCEVVVSVSTDTGIRRARELFASQEGLFVVRYPLDFSPAVARFLDAVRPDVVALVELEVWPNFVRACRERGIPVGVINGRLSARSFRGYRRIRPFLRQSFETLAFVGAQDSDYAQRFRTMGVRDDRLTITGSMKWDAAPGGADGALLNSATRMARELGINPNAPLIVAGSTAPLEGRHGQQTGFDCEEALLHAACPPGVQLLCAPRKPEHYERAFAALGGEAKCVRRSSPTSPHPSLPHSPSRFLLDTIGELRAAYALADVAVIGRTWGDLGGSDPIEPVALGKATLLGPRFSNFESIVATLRDAHAVLIVDGAGLPEALRSLLDDPVRRASLAARGAACITDQRGATHRHAGMVLRALKSDGTPRREVSQPLPTAVP